MKESESRPRKQDEPEGLPKKPTWITSGTSSRQPASLSATRQSVPNVTTGRRPATASQATTTTTARQRTTKTTTTNESTPVVRRDKDKERTKRPSSAVAPGRTQAAGGSRPSSPAVQAIARASTPAAESDQGSSVADSANSPRLEHMSTKATRAGPPPGIPDPSTTKASVQTPPPGFAPVQKAPSHERAPSSSSYQPSTAAQALLDDFRSRRERSSNQTDGSSITGFSPFPDFERTLKNLGLGPSDDGDGGLKFSFDFNIDDDAKGLLDPASDPFFEPEPLRTQTTNVIASPYSGSFNPFEAPPSQPPEHSGWTSAPAFSGFGIPSNTPILSQATIPQASYRGSFDPFADSEPAARPSPAQSYGTPVEGERTSSRFGFARRPTPAGRSSAIQTGRDSVRGSPLVSSPADALPSSPFVSTLDVIAPRPSTQVPHAHWSTGSAPSRPESTQTGPPGLTGPASTSISLSQLFGSNYARRNSLRSVDSGLSPPPGLGAPPRVGADSVTRGLAGSIHGT
jgi:CCR4-NOT transcription complex subunit 4